MMEMGAAHQQQLHRAEINMAHMGHNAYGPTNVTTTLSTMNWAVPAPALVYAAAGYAAPPVAHIPPAMVATIAIAGCGRGCRAGFETVPPTAGGTYAQRIAALTTTNATTHIQNNYKVCNK